MRRVALAATATISLVAPTTHIENVKIAFIDPLSGPFGPVGANLLHTWQTAAEMANKEKSAGDDTFEIVPFDNKASLQKSVNILNGAIGRGTAT